MVLFGYKVLADQEGICCSRIYIYIYLIGSSSTKSFDKSQPSMIKVM